MDSTLCCTRHCTDLIIGFSCKAPCITKAPGSRQQVWAYLQWGWAGVLQSRGGRRSRSLLAALAAQPAQQKEHSVCIYSPPFIIAIHELEGLQEHSYNRKSCWCYRMPATLLAAGVCSTRLMYTLWCSISAGHEMASSPYQIKRRYLQNVSELSNAGTC